MRQLVHDYAWDPVICCDSVNDGKIIDGSACIKSNLVVLFSPIVESIKFLSEFLDVDESDECLADVGLFKSKFGALFESVNDAFCSRDIHFSWVNVKCDLGLVESSSDASVNDFREKNGFFECGIRDMGWGFCSSDSVVLGSSLVHFGLIYPTIGVSSCLFGSNNDYCEATLSLEILDVSGKPLECKFCDLKLVNMEKNRFWGLFGDGIIKLRVTAVYRYDEAVKFEGMLMDPILVRECLGESMKDGKENYSDFFVFRVLEILAGEMGESVRRRGSPIWQILLSFLHRKGYWALVSFLDSNGDTHMGILKPFTVFSALLSIIDDESYTCRNEFGGDNLSPFVNKMDSDICKSNMSAAVGEVKRKQNKKDIHLFQDLTWNDFRKAASESTVIKLEEVYFARECNSSKKLKFLKCWMKQIEKSSCCRLMIEERSKLHKDIPRETENRLAETPQESEQLILSSASVGDESLTEVSRMQDNTALDAHSETSESFFSSLSNKIQQGLESEGVNLGTLAERLVNSSIYWLYQKHEMEGSTESQAPGVETDDACGGTVAIELTKLLLREPKDLIAKHKNDNPSIMTSKSLLTGFASENIVKEYELQILFRMEILQSEAGASIEEPMKQKFVKQICLLLEAIQCHLEGGFFGDWSVDNYVRKIIKRRYSDTLEDVVRRIYTKMDLLLFADEDETSDRLFNSEDSNQSWIDKKQRHEMCENSRINELVSIEEELHWPLENDKECPQGIKMEEQARKVMEAQERRERARRFASFTSWVPDLQRVWAPKQPKAFKPNSNWKLYRKECKRATNDRVCETPMTGNKRSYSTDDEALQNSVTRLSGSVSKALFQDD